MPDANTTHRLQVGSNIRIRIYKDDADMDSLWFLGSDLFTSLPFILKLVNHFDIVAAISLVNFRFLKKGPVRINLDNPFKWVDLKPTHM